MPNRDDPRVLPARGEAEQLIRVLQQSTQAYWATVRASGGARGDGVGDVRGVA